METKPENDNLTDETQSIRIIREMILTSRSRLQNDGILFILWGWIMAALYFAMFIDRKIILGYRINMALRYILWSAVIAALVYTIYYIYRQRSRVQTYIGISLRYIWIAMFICMMLINMILYNVLHEVIFELQHPVYMVVIAFAIVTSGAILRYRLLIAGGTLFGLAAYVSSFMPLEWQLLAESSAWLAAFVIPGYVLYLKRKANNYVQGT